MGRLPFTARSGAMEPRRGAPGAQRCDCYSCQLARKQGAAKDAPHLVVTPTPGVAPLQQMLREVVPASLDAEQWVDDILGRALNAFDARTISEAEFATLTAQCLD
ncbi:MAG: hypothetical protein QFF03_06600, partial [Pseudomonadota bacterium]|nr:hypothetical protein [Pseudomonadota bacterium]